MRISITVFLLFTILSVQSQETIYLNNPSFEDVPRRGGEEFFRGIEGWFDCGLVQFKGESPPDIHPTPNSVWEVDKYALDGDTYLGMVVRDNDSWEALSQKLSSPLLAGTCYSFSILLSKSTKYISLSRETEEETNYSTPTVLRIWGANKFCGRSRLLAESETVDNDQWRQFNFKFKPKDNFSYIVIEAYYKTPVLVPYSGHILVDGASDIVPVSCDAVIEHEPLLVQQSLSKEEVPKNTSSRKTKKPEKASFKSPKPNIGIAVDDSEKQSQVEKPISRSPKQIKPTEEKTIAGITRQKMKKGQTLLIDKIYFEANAFDINRPSFPELNRIYYFLEENEDITIEIQGHTNGTRGITHKFCDELSTKRAKAVATYLAEKGINPGRLKYKGYGKRKPIASNLTPDGKKRNQRVEIKILSLKS